MSSLRRLLLVRTAVAAPGRRSVSGSLVRLALPPSTDPTGQPSSTGPPGHTASPDPWPLPFTEAHLASTTKSTNPDEIELKVDPLDRSYESDLTVTKKRLVYQARKRGMLEGDLLLATFARDHLGQMTAAEVKEFDELMDENDWDIFYWAVNRKEPPARWANSALLDKLRVHTRNEGKVVRFMPDLASAKP